MDKKNFSAELAEIEKEVDDIIKEDGIEGLKEALVEGIMEGVENCINDETDCGHMLRVAKKNGLYNPSVISLVMVSALPMSIETATIAMRSIVVKSDGSPFDLAEDQIKFVKLMEKESKIKFS